MFTIDYAKGKTNSIYSHCLTLRRTVFVIEQQIDENLEMDDKDDVSFHYLLKVDEKPAATARYRETQEGIKLERFAVLKGFRGRGLGQKVLEKILADVSEYQKIIYLNAQESAVSFYLKNHFEIQGQPFFEAGIRHFKMTYVRENG
jgi:predicted GNAT family N-acyltransferase